MEAATARDRKRQPQLLRLARREPVGRAVQNAGKPGALHEVVHWKRRVTHGGGEAKEVLHAGTIRETGRAERHADPSGCDCDPRVEPQEADHAAVDLVDAERGLDDGRLPGAGRPCQGDRRPAADRERHVVEDPPPGTHHRDVREADRRVGTLHGGRLFELFLSYLHAGLSLARGSCHPWGERRHRRRTAPGGRSHGCRGASVTDVIPAASSFRTRDRRHGCARTQLMARSRRMRLGVGRLRA